MSGIGLGLFGNGGRRGISADYFVSSVRGDNSNPGTDKLPFASFDPIGAAFDGMKVAVANGSELWTGYSTGLDGFNGVKFFNYKDSLAPSLERPIIRCDAVINPSEWGFDGSNLYSVNIVLGDDIAEQFVTFYENGRAWRVTLGGQGTTTPGMYFVGDMHSLATTLFARFADGDDPRTNGKVYTYSKQPVGIELVGDNCSIKGFRSYRALGHSGMFAIRGNNGLLKACDAINGNKHNAILSNGSVEDCLFKNAYFGADETNGFASYLVFFQNNGSNAYMNTARNRFTADQFEAYSCGMIWHNQTNDPATFYEKWTGESDHYENIGSSWGGEKTKQTNIIRNPTMIQVGGSMYASSDFDVHDVEVKSVANANRVLDIAASDVTVRLFGGTIESGLFNNTMMRSVSGLTGNRIELHQVSLSSYGTNDGSYSFVQMDGSGCTLVSRQSRYNMSTAMVYAWILGRDSQNSVFDGEDDVYSKEGTVFEFNSATFDSITSVTAMKVATGSGVGSTIDTGMVAPEVPTVPPDVILGNAGLKAWFKMGASDRRTVSDGKFLSIRDEFWAQSIVQGTAASRPTVVDIDGWQEVAHFDHSAVQCLLDPTGVHPNIEGNRWWVGVIFRPTISTGQRCMVACIAPNSSVRVGEDGGPPLLDIYAGGMTDASVELGQLGDWHYGTALLNGDFCVARVDGVEGSFTNAGTGGFKQIVIGSGSGFGPNDSYGGDIAEVIVSDSPLYDLRRFCIEKYFQSRMAA